MLERHPIFPNVIELNHQARHIIGANVYVVYDGDQWLLIDIGYADTVDEIVELIRRMDFPFSQCQTIAVTHTDIDHIQGLAKAKQILRTTVSAHSVAAAVLRRADRLFTFAHVPHHNIDMELTPVEIDRELSEGDRLRVGNLELEVWVTPGHTCCHVCYRMGDLLFSGDNLYRDGCVGAIDAHHGSDLAAYVRSLQRIRDSDVQWLLPGHGPYFRKDEQMLDAVIRRLQGYQHMTDFGTCAVDWPLMDEWEQELMAGTRPQ